MIFINGREETKRAKLDGRASSECFQVSAPESKGSTLLLNVNMFCGKGIISESRLATVDTELRCSLVNLF